jgi:hypothetical protein
MEHGPRPQRSRDEGHGARPKPLSESVALVPVCSNRKSYREKRHQMGPNSSKAGRAALNLSRVSASTARYRLHAETIPRTILRASCQGRLVARPIAGRPPGAVRQRIKISLDWYLFPICRRDEICSDCGPVRPFPRRNRIMAESPVGIDVRHNDRTLEGIPVLP